MKTTRIRTMAGHGYRGYELIETTHHINGSIFHILSKKRIGNKWKWTIIATHYTYISALNDYIKSIRLL